MVKKKPKSRRRKARPLNMVDVLCLIGNYTFLLALAIPLAGATKRAGHSGFANAIVITALTLPSIAVFFAIRDHIKALQHRKTLSVDHS